MFNYFGQNTLFFNSNQYSYFLTVGFSQFGSESFGFVLDVIGADLFEALSISSDFRFYSSTLRRK